MNDGKKLTFMGHLEELRQRLIKAIVAVIICIIPAFFFYRQIFAIITRPAGDINLIYTEMTEMIGTIMKVSLYSGLALAMPVIVYQVVRFIAPALTRSEKRALYLILPGIFLSFLGGVCFGYFVAVPPAVRFLLTFGQPIATPQIKVGNYISLVTTLLFALGVIFETPLVVFFLAKIRVVTPKMLSDRRKYAMLVAFVVAAIITPTFDPVNQTIIAIPIIVLYELSIWLAKLATRGSKRTVPVEA
ncbi:MAG: twin arginine-targeting protein translocase TatC [Chloroflexi bacterium RBG_13_54_9]|nr:MAG: twin arginine-targeting protein translocase TatC [Chloroflexi bacterium RBG_13_54_9]